MKLDQPNKMVVIGIMWIHACPWYLVGLEISEQIKQLCLFIYFYLPIVDVCG